jgi:aryl-alcohol dehydrogenase-like predicted oxidoreductase
MRHPPGMKTPDERQIGRREFLQRSALAFGGLMLGPTLVRAESAPGKGTFFEATDLVELGKSGLKVSRLSLGTGVRGGNRQSNHTRMGREKFQAIIRGCYDRGVRHFDLADLYGTHSYVVPALEGIPRGDYQIVTKLWFGPGGIPEKERPDTEVVVERFLRELKTSYIDLLLLHCVTSPKWPQELSRQMEAMARLKEKGVIRAHGVSCHSLPALRAAAEEAWVDSVHARINPYGMTMDGPPAEVAPVLQKIRAAGKGVVGMKIIGEGRLRSDPERRAASVRYALEMVGIDVLTVGCESLAEVDDMSAMIKCVPRAALA